MSAYRNNEVAKSQLDKFKEAACELTDEDPEAGEARVND